MAASNSKVKLTKESISNVGKHKLTSKELYNAIDIAMQSNVCTTIKRETQQRCTYCMFSWALETPYTETTTSAK